jgi:hypothetical protein
VGEEWFIKQTILIQMRNFEKAQKMLDEIFQCSEHQQFINGMEELTIFPESIHEVFFKLNYPTKNIRKINKNLYHAYNLQAYVYNVKKDYEKELFYHDLADKIAKVDATPNLNAAVSLSQIGQFDLMADYLTKSTFKVEEHAQKLTFFELWGLYYISKGEFEKAYVCLMTVMFMDKTKTEEILEIFKKNKISEMRFDELYKDDDKILNELKKMNIDYVINSPQWSEAFYTDSSWNISKCLDEVETLIKDLELEYEALKKDHEK